MSGWQKPVRRDKKKRDRTSRHIDGPKSPYSESATWHPSSDPSYPSILIYFYQTCTYRNRRVPKSKRRERAAQKKFHLSPLFIHFYLLCCRQTSAICYLLFLLLLFSILFLIFSMRVCVCVCCLTSRSRWQKAPFPPNVDFALLGCVTRPKQSGSSRRRPGLRGILFCRVHAQNSSTTNGLYVRRGGKRQTISSMLLHQQQ